MNFLKIARGLIWKLKKWSDSKLVILEYVGIWGILEERFLPEQYSAEGVLSKENQTQTQV